MIRSVAIQWQFSRVVVLPCGARFYVAEENVQKVVRFFSSGRILFHELNPPGRINYRVSHYCPSRRLSLALLRNPFEVCLSPHTRSFGMFSTAGTRPITRAASVCFRRRVPTLLHHVAASGDPLVGLQIDVVQSGVSLLTGVGVVAAGKGG